MKAFEVAVPEQQYAALAAVIGERRYQDDQYAGYDTSVAGEEILLLAAYVDRAREQLISRAVSPRRIQDTFRKIAAIAVRALEHGGAPQRIGYGDAEIEVQVSE